MPARYRYNLSEPTEGDLTLENEPLNWESLKFTLRRNKQFYGITRLFSQDLEFWGDGEQFITNVYDRTGVNSEITITVEYYDFQAYTYVLLYQGRINLSKYSRNFTDDGLVVVRCNIEQKGFDQKILNGTDVPINYLRRETRTGQIIQPYSEETQAIDYEGVTLSNEYDARNTDFGNTLYEAPNLPIVDVPQDEGVSRFLGITVDEVNIDRLLGVTPVPTTIREQTQPVYWRVPFTGTYRIDITGSILFSFGFVPSGLQQLESVTSVFQVLINEELIDFDTESSPLDPGDTVKTMVHNFSTTPVTAAIELEEGDNVVFQNVLSGSVEPTAPVSIPYTVDVFEARVVQFNLNISSSETLENTDIEAVYPFELFNRLTESLTDVPQAFESTVLSRLDQDFNPPPQNDGVASRIMTTTGKLIRQTDLESTTFETTLGDAFNSFDAFYMLGASIDPDANVFRIEPRETFYVDTVVKTIEQFSISEQAVDNDLYFNTFKIGFANWESEDRNVRGILEFNGQRDYTTSAITTQDKKYKKLSPYIGAGYVIEYLRGIVDPEEQSKYDDDLFVIATNNTAPITKEKPDDYAPGIIIVGMPFYQTLTNWRISPTQCARRHLTWLSSSNFKGSDPVFRFQGGKGNFNLYSTAAGREDSDLFLDRPILVPETVTVTTPWVYEDMTEVLDNVYGKIRIEDIDGRGRNIEGYIEEIEWEVEQQTANITLTVDPVEIGTPTNLTADQSGLFSASLNWTVNEPDAIDHVVSVSLTSGEVTAQVATGSGVDHADIPLPAAGRYFFTVRTVTPDGSSEESNEAFADVYANRRVTEDGSTYRVLESWPGTDFPQDRGYRFTEFDVDTTAL